MAAVAPCRSRAPTFWRSAVSSARRGGPRARARRDGRARRRAPGASCPHPRGARRVHVRFWATRMARERPPPAPRAAAACAREERRGARPLRPRPPLCSRSRSQAPGRLAAGGRGAGRRARLVARAHLAWTPRARCEGRLPPRRARAREPGRRGAASAPRGLAGGHLPWRARPGAPGPRARVPTPARVPLPAAPQIHPPPRAALGTLRPRPRRATLPTLKPPPLAGPPGRRTSAAAPWRRPFGASRRPLPTSPRRRTRWGACARRVGVRTEGRTEARVG